MDKQRTPKAGYKKTLHARLSLCFSIGALKDSQKQDTGKPYMRVYHYVLVSARWVTCDLQRGYSPLQRVYVDLLSDDAPGFQIIFFRRYQQRRL
jgi:hypothetical protein